MEDNHVADSPEWQRFADFLSQETGVKIRVSALKRMLKKIVKDEIARHVVETGGDRWLDTVFVEDISL